MKTWHSNRDLEPEGKRILDLLRERHCLDEADLRTVSKIVDESESVALGILTIYGALLVAILATLLLAELATGLRKEELNVALIGLVFVAFIAHYIWEFRCDNYRKQISNRLKCRKCSQQLYGLRIRQLARSGNCPNCGCDRSAFFGLDS